MSTSFRRVITSVIAIFCFAATLLTSTTAGAAVATPTFLRSIGFSGHAGVYAWGAATGTDGSIYISDYNNYVIHRFAPDGTLIRTFSGRGSGPGQTQQPYNLAVDPNDGSVYMADLTPHEVEKYNAAGIDLDRQRRSVRRVLHAARRRELPRLGVRRQLAHGGQLHAQAHRVEP